MAGRQFPLPLSQAESLEALREDLNELILFLQSNFSIETENSVTTYETGWSDGTDEVEFVKDPNNRVFIRGTAAHAGPTPPETIFTLPAGYRPGVKIVSELYRDHVIEVDTDGTVDFISGTWSSSTNLTGITFFAEG